jgi:radical SAM superfamily enzyme YgiQ (UPF0313 family)
VKSVQERFLFCLKGCKDRLSEKVEDICGKTYSRHLWTVKMMDREYRAHPYGIDTVQIMILTPLPGTPLFNDMMKSGRLLHTDWSKYDVQHVVFKPRHISPTTLQIETLRAMGRFYSWKYVFRHLAKLNFHYAAVGIFGKRAVDKSLKAFSACLDDSASTSVSCGDGT